MEPKILVFVGTRPEAIKMAPVYLALKARPGLKPVLAASGQHRDLVGPTLSDFGLSPDLSLETMSGSSSLASLSARLLSAVDKLLAREKPAAVLVQGDTLTVMATAKCAFFRQIPVGHVEAGLRTGDLRVPFPEEMIRRAVSLMTNWHFAPTATAAENLRKEGLEGDQILVTGNTVIDALKYILDREPGPTPRLDASPGPRLLLVTCHRRENHGPNLVNICQALRQLTETHPDLQVIFPVHPNPRVRETVEEQLRGRRGIVLIRPLAYKKFIHLAARCEMILTDSGGLQEEGPALGKPVLILREVTERLEGVGAGLNRLVGTEPASIMAAVAELLADGAERRGVGLVQNPFGDGRASERIADFLETRLLHDPPKRPVR